MTAFADYVLTRELQAVDGGLLALTSPTEVIADNEDTDDASVSFGFTFNFDGADYTSCTVYSDGWLKLAGAWPTSQYQNNVFGATGNTSVSLHPWHDDLETEHTTGYVRHETLGSAPNRYCVIEWRCYARYDHNAGNNILLTFQAVLRETSNNIEFRYAPAGADYGVTGSPGTSVSATIGARISTAGGVTGNVREFTELAGTPIANGGVDASPFKLDCSPEPGNEWPGDASNTIVGAPFNFHFTATPEEVDDGGDPLYSTPALLRTPGEADDATYVGPLHALLPRGRRLWGYIAESRLADLIRAASIEWGRIHNRVLDMLAESDPRTCDETIGDWEDLLGLPVAGYAPTTLSDRRAAAWAAYTASGGGSADYLVELAARHGYTITITRAGAFPAFRCDSSGCDEPIRGERWLYSFTVYGSTADEDGLRALIDRIAPSEAIAHYVLT